MMSIRLKLALSLLCAFPMLPIQAHAASPAKTLVTITCSCDDATGKAYAKAFSAALSANPLYREVSAEEGSEQDAIRINIVSMPLASDGTERPKSALSIVALHQGALLHQFIETCDRIPIEQCAQSLVASLKEWDSDQN
jgi:hypothetical protein